VFVDENFTSQQAQEAVREVDNFWCMEQLYIKFFSEGADSVSIFFFATAPTA
jgi:hypothetical protein